MADYELYGTRSCPYTEEMREWLDLKGIDFAEYDVEADPHALARLRAISGSQGMVPVLVIDGRISQIGWQGRGCLVSHA